MLARFLALAVGFLVPVSSGSAQDRWILLASHDLELGSGNASIDLDAAQPVKQVRLAAKAGNIVLSKVVISYRDGRSHTEERRISLLAGERTKPIDPREQEGFAERVALVLDGVPKPAGVARSKAWGLAGTTKPPAVAQETEVDDLNAQIAQLYQADKYSEALPVAERYVALAKSQHGEDDPRYATALAWLVKLYLKQGKYVEAEPLARRVLAIRERKLGAEHLDTASSLIELAEVVSYQNRQAEAAPLEQRAVEIREKTLGPKHPDTAQALRGLGGSYQGLGRVADAEALFKRALAIREEVLGSDHPAVGESLSDFANLYYTQARYAEAEPLYKRSLEIREKALGPDHAVVAESLNGLAILYYAQQRYADAEPLWKRSLEIKEKTLGPDHADVATILSNLAELYRQQARHADAEPLHQRALAIREKALGPDHADIGETLNNLANLYYAQQRYAEAEPLWKRSLEIQEKALGPHHADVATSLDNLANLYYAQDRYAEAEPLYKRSLEIREKALGPDHADVASSLNNLANLSFTQQRYAEAEPLYKRSLEIKEKTLGPDHADVSTLLDSLAEVYRLQGRDVANSLDNLANVYFAQERFAEAEPPLKRSLEIRERALGPDHLYVAASLNNLANVYFAQERFAKAEPLFKRALAIREKALGPDHVVVVTSLSWLAFTYFRQGKFDLAEPLFKRALAIREKTWDPDHPDVAQSLDALAQTYALQGKYDLAEPLHKRALAIREKALGPDHFDVGDSLNGLADLYRHQGQYDLAEPLYKRSLSIFEKVQGPDGGRVGRALYNLAELYFRDQDRDDLAEPLHKRALAIREKLNGPNHTDVGSSLGALAVLYRDQGKFDLAEPLSQRALAIKEVSGPDQSVSWALGILATIYNAQGKYELAEPLYTRSLAICERVRGPSHPACAVILHNLASFYDSQGKFDLAEPLSKRSLEIREKKLGPDHRDVAISLDGLAKHYFAQRDLAQAVDFWRQSASVFVRRAARGTPESGPGQALTGKKQSDPERARRIFWNLVGGSHRLASDMPSMDASLAREMFQMAQWVLGSDAAQSLAQMGARGVKGDPALAALVRERQDLVSEWQKRDDARSAAVSQAPDQRDRAAEVAAAGRLAAIDARIAAIDKDLGTKFFDYAQLANPAPLSVEDVQTQLEADEALVVFLVIAEEESSPDRQKSTPEETFIWVVTRTSSRWVRSALGREALRREVAALRCGLDYDGTWGTTGSRCTELLETSYTWDDHVAGRPLPFDRARAHELYTSLFGQIEDLIKDKHLLIVPSGALTQLPFQVLVTDPSDPAIGGADAFRRSAWLVRRHALTVLPSVSSLKTLRQSPTDNQAMRALIGFGNPLLDGPDARYLPGASAARSKQDCPETPELRIAELGSERRGVRPLELRRGLVDVTQIRMQVPLPETADELCAVAHALGVGGDDIRLGGRATEGEIKRLSEAGELSNYRVVHLATHGALAGGVEGSSEAGLMLTPPPRASETDDGYLTASEITELKLNADWVILSACNTAAGGAEGAEALSGLARAFFYAGARALLVSHWSVYSQATVKLITKALGAMAADKNVGRAEAMRRSMLALIDTGESGEAHPAFWAPFVVVGEGAATR